MGLRGWDAKVATDLPRKVVRDFVVAWHRGSLSVGWVAPPRMIAAFTDQLASMVYQMPN